MKAFILSAGLGKRLLPYSLKTSKPCIAFLNIPLIAFNLQHLINIGVTEFIFNTHHLHEKTTKIITNLLKNKGVPCHFSHEETLLNSAGGLKKVTSFLNKEQDFLMVNADSLCLGNSIFLQKSINLHKKNQALATLLCCPSPSINFQTIEINKTNNQILNIGPVSENHLHYVGYMIVSSKIFPLIKEKNAHIFNDVLLPYIKSVGLNSSDLNTPKVFANYIPSWKFFEMGNIADFKSAEKECTSILQNNKNSEWENHLTKSLSNFSD